MPPASRRSSTSETVTSPIQPSASSDSEQELGSISGPGSSPSLEERLKKFTEDYDSWSSNGRSSSSSHYVNNYRHAVPEIAVPEPPILLKMVAKNSMFDEDSKRLENVSDKYTPPPPTPTVSSTVTSKNAFASFSGNTLGSLSPMLSSENVSTISAIKIQQPVTITTMIHQRLGSSGTGSPLNSPNTASPYNSPNPSSASSISSVKGLQYPFPSHQQATAALTNAAAAAATATSNSVPIVTQNCVAQQKPKTTATPALGKSMSLPETQTSTTPSANNNLSNLNVSCNKSSTNNLNNVNSISTAADVSAPTKSLMKSVSLPATSGPADVETLSKPSDDKKSTSPEQQPVEEVAAVVDNNSARKEAIVEVERKIHSKDKRNDNDENVKKEREVKKEKEVKKSREQEIDMKKVDEKKSSSSSSKNHKRSKDEHHHTSSSDDKRDESERAASPIHEQRKRCVSFEDVSSVDSANEQHSTTTTTASSKESKHTDKRHNHNNHRKSSKDKSHDDEGHSKSTKDSIFDELKRNSKDNIMKLDKGHKSSSKKHSSHSHHHHSQRENSLKDKENQTIHNDTSAAEEIGRSSDDEIHASQHKQRRQESSEESSGKKKTPRSSLNNSLSTDDSEDSAENKKSIFDIPDEPQFISMYDKVKARSCKNLKKIEDEKKIKDKFTALKQSRAKRDQKRLNTSDDDTDSDAADNGSHEMFKYKSQLSASDEDEAARHSKKKKFSSMNEEESSEGGITDHRKRSKVASTRKLSRTNVIDSSDDDMPESAAKPSQQEEKPDAKSSTSSAFDFDNESSKNNHKNSSKKRHYDKSKDDKSSKKSKKVSRELHRKSSSDKQRSEDKMEEIFGPISDDDMKSEMSNVANSIEPSKEIESSVSDLTVQQKEQQKEESRKRKEKRRREREKQRAMKEEENSVDLDEAGRVLEAQLMSDSDQKTNNNDHTKDSKSTDDVFRFTDGDDEMKRDHHDSNKKKKKKKRAKEERKHHHNHHHYDATAIKEEPIDSTIESSGAFNNNNNTKLRLDVIKDDIKPSVQSLIEDMPPVTIVNQVHVKKEVKVPGFGGAVDAKIHEKAVLSIAQELDKKSVKIEQADKPVGLPESTKKPDAEKADEKSRVVISQKETADAVAALLGESFSMDNEDDYCDPYDVPIVENEPEPAPSAVIAPEEDEEMKKAIMSLNSEINPKPDTPQSEHDLQIDTDNDESHDVEDESMSQSFDNPPKTPDVDMTQLEKVKKDAPTTTPEKLNISGKSDDSKCADLPNIPVTPNFDIAVKDNLTPQKVEPEKKIVASFESRFHAPPTISIPAESESSKHKQTSSSAVKSPKLQSPRSSSSSDVKPHEPAKSVDKKKPDERVTSPSTKQPSPPQIVFPAEKSDQQQQWQVNSSSVIQKTESAKGDTKKHSEVESSYDEEEIDDGKRGRSNNNAKQQKGRKAATPPTEDAKARSAKTPAAPKRGRGGKANAKSTAQSGNRQQKTSESDVYEFHDDSGDDSSVVKSNDAQRQRLNNKTVSPTSSAAPAPVAVQPQQPAPVVTEPTPEPHPLLHQEQVPSPAVSDEFSQQNNTRKSMRLIEKDGTRTSVDDTIDDVIRNVAPPPASNNVQCAQKQQPQPPQAIVSSRRTTRQSTPANAASSPQPSQLPSLHHQQTPTTIPAPNQHLQLPPAPLVVNEVKKPSRAVAKKQQAKDRKTSENSENENLEKKVDVVAQQVQVKVETQQVPIPSSTQQQQQHPTPQPAQVIVSQIPIKNSEPIMPVQTVKKESSELLQLIDPVTGEMQKMTQSKEGQYVPVAENRGLPVHHHPSSQMTVKQLPPQFTIELKKEEKKPATVSAPPPSMPATIVKVAPTIIQEPAKSIAEQQQQHQHAVKPVITQNPTYSKPTPVQKPYVMGPQAAAVVAAKSQIVTPVPPTTVISSPSMMKVNPQIVQHPSTIYNLQNIIPPPTVSKQMLQQQPQPMQTHQKTIVLPPQHQAQPPTIIHQTSSTPQMVHQKMPQNVQPPPSQIVIQSQQPAGNLMISIPPSSASQQQQQSMHSPRLQVKQQVIQRPMPPSQHQQPQPTPSTVVMKTGQPMTLEQQQKMLQSGKIGPESQSYITQGREIIYVGSNIQKQTIYPNYHSSARTQPVQTAPKPQQIVQPVPHSPKIVASSQPSLSVTQIQIPASHHQQPQQQQSPKVYFTNSGQVITSVPSSQQSQDMRPDERWIQSHEKMASQPQPLKARYMMESHEDSRLHADRVPHQAATLKRSYVIEGAMPHQATSQSIMPPQNKTVIGLNQSPQILTGAVASPPLAKAHISAQQPIVTGKCRRDMSSPNRIKNSLEIQFSFSPTTGASSSRIAIPIMSPKDLSGRQHYAPEAYDEAAVMVSYPHRILAYTFLHPFTI